MAMGQGQAKVHMCCNISSCPICVLVYYRTFFNVDAANYWLYGSQLGGKVMGI